MNAKQIETAIVAATKANDSKLIESLTAQLNALNGVNDVQTVDVKIVDVNDVKIVDVNDVKTVDVQTVDVNDVQTIDFNNFDEVVKRMNELKAGALIIGSKTRFAGSKVDSFKLFISYDIATTQQIGLQRNAKLNVLSVYCDDIAQPVGTVIERFKGVIVSDLGFNPQYGFYWRSKILNDEQIKVLDGMELRADDAIKVLYRTYGKHYFRKPNKSIFANITLENENQLVSLLAKVGYSLDVVMSE